MNADFLAFTGWFSSNGLAVNRDNCLSMCLGSSTTNPSYYFEKHEINSIDAIKLLGVTTDRELNFTDHVAAIVRKIINQLQVVKRHKRLIDTNSKITLDNAYFLPQLNYCSIVCHFVIFF